MSRGLDGTDLFTDDTDRNLFVGKLAALLSQSSCLCYAWCLMPTHFHLVLRPLDTPLETLMRRLNGSYARRFNKAHGRRGYLYQDRYKSVVVQDSSYVRDLIRYIHLNPLRAGLVSSLDRLETCRWSGHRALLGLDKCPWMAVKEALSRFSPRPSRAREVYRKFLAEGEERGGAFDSIWDEIRRITQEEGGDARFGDGRVVGEPAFVRTTIERAEAEETTLRSFREARPELSSLLLEVCRRYDIGEAAEMYRGRKRGCSQARAEFCYLAYRRYGYSLSCIGAFLGMKPASVYTRATGYHSPSQQI
jgi:REP element-mobilizing transposase RayT